MDDKQPLRWFLVKNFMIILLVVAIIETLISEVVNRCIFPFVQANFFANMNFSMNGTGAQMLIVVFVILGELILMAMEVIVPSHIKPMIQYIIDQIGYVAIRQIPEFNIKQQIAQFSVLQSLLLFGIVIAVISMVIIPYIVAAIIFSWLVTNEVNKINEHEKKMHAEYDKKRNLMLSDIAHDLRTPITTICGYSKALQDGMVKDEKKQKDYLNAIQRKSLRMSELINLLFEYVKLDSEGFCLNKKKIDLFEVIRTNAAVNYSDIEEKGMELEVDIPDSICYVEADELQLSRVITNLLTNAIRHNHEGNHIYLGIKQIGPLIQVIVADDGEKIPPEVAQHLFEPFAVGDESRTSKGGSGLGLSIAAKIVEMHGWKIIFQTENVKYQKAFVITIPNII